MKYIKKKNNLNIYINKSLKNGKKYKYYIYFKNIIRFYLKYILIVYKILGINLKLTKQLINKDSLIQNYHSFIYNIKITRKKKKKLKNLNIVKLTKKENIPNEMYKLFNSITWYLKVRSYNLKLFYIFFSINNRNLKNNKIYKELTQIYYSKLNYQIEKKKIYLKKKILLHLNTNNINNIFVKKYNLINTINKINFIKHDNYFRYRFRYFKKKIIKINYNKNLNNIKIQKIFFFFKNYFKWNYKYIYKIKKSNKKINKYFISQKYNFKLQYLKIKNNLKKNKHINNIYKDNFNEKIFFFIRILYTYFNKLIKLI